MSIKDYFVKEDGDIPCSFGHDSEAIGIFYAPEGCICKPETVQALCGQHALKAVQNGVDLRIIHWLFKDD